MENLAKQDLAQNAKKELEQNAKKEWVSPDMQELNLNSGLGSYTVENNQYKILS
jgi:hypothetical protein